MQVLFNAGVLFQRGFHRVRSKTEIRPGAVLAHSGASWLIQEPLGSEWSVLAHPGAILALPETPGGSHWSLGRITQETRATDPKKPWMTLDQLAVFQVPYVEMPLGPGGCSCRMSLEASEATPLLTRLSLNFWRICLYGWSVPKPK